MLDVLRVLLQLLLVYCAADLHHLESLADLPQLPLHQARLVLAGDRGCRHGSRLEFPGQFLGELSVFGGESSIHIF